MRYAIRCLKSGTVTFTYHCNADLVESTKYWAKERHPDCTIEVAPECS